MLLNKHYKMIVRTSLTESNNFKKIGDPRNAIFKTRKEEFEEFIDKHHWADLETIIEEGFPLYYIKNSLVERLLKPGKILEFLNSDPDLNKMDKKFISDTLEREILNADSRIRLPYTKSDKLIGILRKDFPRVFQAIKKFPLPFVSGLYAEQYPGVLNPRNNYFYDYVYKNYFNPFDYDPVFLVKFINNVEDWERWNVNLDEIVIGRYFRDFTGYSDYFINNVPCEMLDDILLCNMDILNGIINRKCRMSKSRKTAFIEKSLKRKSLANLWVQDCSDGFLEVLNKVGMYIGPSNFSKAFIKRINNNLAREFSCPLIKEELPVFSRYLSEC